MGKPYATFGLLAAATAIPVVAHGAVYLSDEQAAHALFPGMTMKRKLLVLTPAETEAIEARSGQTVRSTELVAWVSDHDDKEKGEKGTVLIDQVLGKHELITYAVGIKGDGTIQGIEVLEYRESYGGDVQKPAWRGQFVGKDKRSPLAVGDDIVNISGGTLSSAHVTGGVRRLLHTYDLIRNRL
jgi:Na+-translocating ferredoxin:NAD+ oxidoreductase RnfG subunit